MVISSPFLPKDVNAFAFVRKLCSCPSRLGRLLVGGDMTHSNLINRACQVGVCTLARSKSERVCGTCAGEARRTSMIGMIVIFVTVAQGK